MTVFQRRLSNSSTASCHPARPRRPSACSSSPRPSRAPCRWPCRTGSSSSISATSDAARSTRVRRALAREKKRGECWRFLVLQELAAGPDGGGGKQPSDFTAIAAATAVRAETGGFHFGGLNAGPFVAGTERLIRRAEVTLTKSVNDTSKPPACRSCAVRGRAPASGSLEPGGRRSIRRGDLLIATPPSNPALEPGEPMLPASSSRLYAARRSGTRGRGCSPRTDHCRTTSCGRDLRDGHGPGGS